MSVNFCLISFPETFYNIETLMHFRESLLQIVDDGYVKGDSPLLCEGRICVKLFFFSFLTIMYTTFSRINPPSLGLND